MWKLTIVTNFDENDIFDILSADEKTNIEINQGEIVRIYTPVGFAIKIPFTYVLPIPGVIF